MRSWRKGLILAAFFLGCQSKNVSGLTAPDFDLKDLSGKTVSLKSFRGHPVLLDFWASWCGPCRISIPSVEDFYQRHQQDGLVVLGLNMDDDPSQVYPFVKQMKMSYPVLFAAASNVGSDYGLQGIPGFVFIDAKGQLVERYQGFAPQMLEEWEALLREMKSATPTT